MDKQARAALRPFLEREPTAAEVRYLRMGESALGDKDLLRLQAENSIEQMKSLRSLRGELLTEMRGKLRQMRKLRSKARRKRGGKSSSRTK